MLCVQGLGTACGSGQSETMLGVGGVGVGGGLIYAQGLGAACGNEQATARTGTW